MIKQIMPTRMKDLGYALDGYDKTDIYGVSFEDGKFQGLSSGADDKGI